MAKTRSMSARDAAPWSSLDQNLLVLVMMRLMGVIDFFAFSGVCKTWRSVALNNKSMFMESRLPMYIRLSDRSDQRTCFLQDHEGRRFKTNFPQFAGRICVGVTCGYVILFGEKTHDFWLVNPITRCQLHFPNVSFPVYRNVVRAILVNSPSLSAAVFVITNLLDHGIWFSIAGKGAWNRVSSVNCLLDLHAFKGKIYALTTSIYRISDLENICELTLAPEPKLTKVEIKTFSLPGVKWAFVSSDENLYVVRFISEEECRIHEVDIGEMKLMPHAKTSSEYAFFLGSFKSSAAVNPLSWTNGCPKVFSHIPSSGKLWLNMANMWYFPHDSLKVSPLDV